MLQVSSLICAIKFIALSEEVYPEDGGTGNENPKEGSGLLSVSRKGPAGSFAAALKGADCAERWLLNACRLGTGLSEVQRCGLTMLIEHIDVRVVGIAEEIQQGMLGRGPA